jgi:hypothetical protein
MIVGIPSRSHREKQSEENIDLYMLSIPPPEFLETTALDWYSDRKKGETETGTLCLKVEFRYCEVLTLSVSTLVEESSDNVPRHSVQ